ncbi:MscL family protein [[Mycoplasma] falconis]|uniref:MscL family protein n=1 Tax=[Mycoplasma] falconis TaxID=92403 RepID=A0A501XAT6_9BACT|nr:MscL family protein [[Mycoplasma] falconis]TPE57539.1 MscL family protein [[Mycoplasma] falconis]
MTRTELEQKRHVVKNAYVDAKKAVLRGNMIMLAIGLLIGTSFGALVSSLANDIIMSAITRAMGENVSFNTWVVWPGALDANGVPQSGIFIGKFLGALLQFVIVAGFIFFGLLIAYTIKNSIDYRKAKKQPIEEPKPEVVLPTNEELMLAELRKLNELLSAKKAAPARKTTSKTASKK